MNDGRQTRQLALPGMCGDDATLFLPHPVGGGHQPEQANRYLLFLALLPPPPETRAAGMGTGR